MTLWKDFHLHPTVLESLWKLGYKSPTSIQEKTLVHTILHRKDVIGAAETVLFYQYWHFKGSGKTLAFGLPMLNELASKTYDHDGVMGLVLVPTRELALQVVDHLKKAGSLITNKVSLDYFWRFQIVAVVGGMSIDKQRRLLAKVPEILVATPGRLWALLSEVNRRDINQ